MKLESFVSQNLFSSPEKIKLFDIAVQVYLSEYLIHSFEQFIMGMQHRKKDLLVMISRNIFRVWTLRFELVNSLPGEAENVGVVLKTLHCKG